MFGAYRLVLAIFVMVTHIGHIEVIGGLAVWAFFMLSGFLITGVLNTRYGYSLSGLSGFAVSRIFRLYPTYWVVALLALWVTSEYRSMVDPSLVNLAFQPLSSMREWLSGVLIIGHTVFGLGRVDHAWSPSIWAVDVEIGLYVMSCIFVSRSRVASRNTFLFCLALYPFLWLVAKEFIRNGDIDTGVQLIYSFLPAALLPYSMGAFLWFVRDLFIHVKPTLLSLLMGVVLVFVLAIWGSRISVTAVYILSLPVFGYLMISLSNITMPHPFSRVDDLFGRMSYPMYLSHLAGAYVVILVADKINFMENVAVKNANGMFEYTFTGFFITLLFVSSFSWALANFLERPMDVVRHVVARKVSERMRSLRIKK